MAGIRIRLLGPPSIDHDADLEGQQPRGRKSWGLLVYLLLHGTATPRSLLAAVLFPGADDPLGALRWHLSDLRRAIGPGTELQGGPVVLRLPSECRCDADFSGETTAFAGTVPTGELLARFGFSGCPGFDTCLTVERHRIRHFVETCLYENGLDAPAEGNLIEAVQLAGQAVGLDGVNADFHALLVRALLASGDRAAARAHAAKCARLFDAQFGSGLPAVQHSLAIFDRGHWVAYRPLVEALRSEGLLLSGFTVEAEDMADHAPALAEAFGDRCDMDAAVHAKTQILPAAGDHAAAQSWIARGLRPDPCYRWFRSGNLDLACKTTLQLDPSRAFSYAWELSSLSSRHGHDELTVRAYSFRAVLGDAAASTALPRARRASRIHFRQSISRTAPSPKPESTDGRCRPHSSHAASHARR